MQILFATSNPHKLREANDVGNEHGIEFIQLQEPYPEIRDEDVGKVAEDGARYVFERVKQPVLVDDTGLYIDALAGFPGPYSAYVFRKIGSQGILKLMEDSPDRTALFVSAVGFCAGGKVKVFRGECKGAISKNILGEQLFGYDPIFIPESCDKTFAQDPQTKDRVSHRRKSFEAFCHWYLSK